MKKYANKNVKMKMARALLKLKEKSLNLFKTNGGLSVS